MRIIIYGKEVEITCSNECKEVTLIGSFYERAKDHETEIIAFKSVEVKDDIGKVVYKSSNIEDFTNEYSNDKPYDYTKYTYCSMNYGSNTTEIEVDDFDPKLLSFYHYKILTPVGEKKALFVGYGNEDDYSEKDSYSVGFNKFIILSKESGKWKIIFEQKENDIVINHIGEETRTKWENEAYNG